MIVSLALKDVIFARAVRFLPNKQTLQGKRLWIANIITEVPSTLLFTERSQLLRYLSSFIILAIYFKIINSLNLEEALLCLKKLPQKTRVLRY